MKRFSLFIPIVVSLLLLLSFSNQTESQTTPRLVLFEAFMRPT